MSVPILTPRQEEIVALLAAGRTSKQLADELGISPRTVEMHLQIALERNGCRTRTQLAVRYAVCRAVARLTLRT